jgi:putative acetyltransferase
MPARIAVETPLQDDVRQLVARLNAYLNPLSPPEFQFQMTVEQMAEPETTLFIARNAVGEAVGMGALKVHSPALAEVKRMFTLPETRGKGIGSAILAHIVAEARTRGVGRLALETGTEDVMPMAWALYRRNGFTRCDAFLDYPSSDYNAFFDMRLL